MENKELVPISASKLKQFDSCSWSYWCRYHLKLPESTNDGALKGSIVHKIFEVLLNKKRKNLYKSIIKSGTVKNHKSINKLVKKQIKKLNLPKETFSHIDEMILVGLKADFISKGYELVAPEYKFDIINESPKYRIKGFIDKPLVNNTSALIDDFKSSKKKFEGDDHHSNIQALMYSLAAKKLWPDLAPIVRFIFLQFKDDPILKVEFNDNTLRGFENYLEYIQEKINNFTEEDAKMNFAYDQGMPSNGGFKGTLLCGRATYPGELKKDGTVKFFCPFKFKFNYYEIRDKNTKEMIYNIFEKDKDSVNLKENEEIILKEYSGCAKHNNPLAQIKIKEKDVENKNCDIFDDFG